MILPKAEWVCLEWTCVDYLGSSEKDVLKSQRLLWREWTRRISITFNCLLSKSFAVWGQGSGGKDAVFRAFVPSLILQFEVCLAYKRTPNRGWKWLLAVHSANCWWKSVIVGSSNCPVHSASLDNQSCYNLAHTEHLYRISSIWSGAFCDGVRVSNIFSSIN